MPWLWFIGPIGVVAIYLLTTLWPGPAERRRRAAAARWVDESLPPLKRKKGEPTSRRIHHLPPPFGDIVDRAGGGSPVLDVTLVPKNAYLVVRAADAVRGSDHQTVVCRLDEPAPRFTCRPMPIVDGKPSGGGTVPFGKDPDFAYAFAVDAPAGVDHKAVRRWLGADLREALLELPELWLRSEGGFASLTIYGDADTAKLDALVAVADALYAEHGASGGSLFGKGEKGSKASKQAPAAPPSDAPVKERRLAAGAIDAVLYGIALALVAGILGVFSWFHPEALFQSADRVVTEPWQGGWTTKGVGAFVATEALLLGLLILQAALHLTRGQSIGKLLVGLVVRRLDGKPHTVRTAVLQRTWALGALVLVVTAVLTRPFQVGTFFASVATLRSAIIAAVVAALATVPLFLGDGKRALQDYLAGTEVVAAPRWKGLDDLQRRQLIAGVGILGIVSGIALLALLRFEWDSWFEPFEKLYGMVKKR